MNLNSVTFWLNAFLPNLMCQQKGALFVVTVPIPNGTPTPSLRFFTGDQREFSSDPEASARMHSEVKIEGLSSDTPRLASQKNVCGESHEVDDTGSIIASATASSERMQFTDLRVSGDLVQIDLIGSAKLPLLSSAPEIVYSGTLTINRVEGNLRFQGELPGFPFFEMYFRVDDGTVQPLAQIPPPDPSERMENGNRKVDLAAPLTR